MGVADRGNVLVETWIGDIVAVFVGEDPGDAGGGGGFDKFCLLLWWCHCSHSDDEGILALKGRHERGLVCIINFFDLNTGWCRDCAVRASDGGDGVLSRLYKLFRDKFANAATNLLNFVRLDCLTKVL